AQDELRPAPALHEYLPPEAPVLREREARCRSRVPAEDAAGMARQVRAEAAVEGLDVQRSDPVADDLALVLGDEAARRIRLAVLCEEKQRRQLLQRAEAALLEADAAQLGVVALAIGA